jgi:hypothetical protein
VLAAERRALRAAASPSPLHDGVLRLDLGTIASRPMSAPTRIRVDPVPG